MSTDEPQGRDGHGAAQASRLPRWWGPVDALLVTVALYAFAGWVYIALNAVVHPQSLPWRLTHFASWPREDTFGAVCFATSFLCTLVRRIARCWV